MRTLHTRSTYDAATNQANTVGLSTTDGNAKAPASCTQEAFKDKPSIVSRYRVSLSDMTSTLKASSVWIVIGVLATIISLIEKACRGKTVTASIVMGEALSYLALYLCIAHITNFKGRSRRSWLISWLFRLTMLFASFSVSESVSEATKYYTLSWLYHGPPAFLIATLSTMWQYGRQTKTTKQHGSYSS